MVEGGGLENRWRGNSLLGSNPSPSAIFSCRASGLPLLVRQMVGRSILLVLFEATLRRSCGYYAAQNSQLGAKGWSGV